MKIARLITTWDCNRDCDLCCNKTLKIVPTPCRLQDLQHHDQVLITGGEPSLYIDKTLDIIRALKHQSPEQTVYVYTALWRPGLYDVAKLVDGIHYTLHYPTKYNDLIGFEKFQEMIGEPKLKGKSFRLYMEPRIHDKLPVIPNRWSRIEVKPWLSECPLPENEVLLQLEER